MNEQLRGYIWQFVAYAFALMAVIYFYNEIDNEMALIWKLLISNVVATTVIFIFSYAFKNASFYDPYWSVQPIVIVTFLILEANDKGDMWRQLAVLLVVFAWGIRLTWNFLRSWTTIEHEDWRYVNFRETTGIWFPAVSYFGIMMFPTLLVYLGCLPLFDALIYAEIPFNIFDGLAILFCGSAFILQFVADNQLRNFVKNRTDRSQILNTGLWKYSRHPNYFGEILFWIGIAAFGASAHGDIEWYHATGAISIILLFNFISIPMQEKQLVKRKPHYVEEQKIRSKLFLWRPKT